MIQIDIDMPTNCADCPVFNAYDMEDGYCGQTLEFIPMKTFNDKRLDNCPLKEVKNEID